MDELRSSHFDNDGLGPNQGLTSLPIKKADKGKSKRGRDATADLPEGAPKAL